MTRIACGASVLVEVSIILTVFNTSEYLERCLNSLISQTFRDMEIICIDDGSTDDSLEILKRYRYKDDRIILITQKNSGAGAARNAGLKIARGKYISFLDSDDFFETDMIKKAYKCIEKNICDFCVFRSDSYIESDGSFIEAPWTIHKQLLPNNKVFSSKDVERDLFRLFIGWAWDKLYSLEFIRENDIWFQEIRTSNDMLFVFSALVKAERISVINNILAHHRRREDSLSMTREPSWQCFYYALMKLKERLLEWQTFDTLERDFVNYCLHSSLWNMDTLYGTEKKQLFEKLKEKWFDEFGITGRPSSYFYNEEEYAQYVLMMESEDYNAWNRLMDVIE